jgi:hypothetical protein
MNNQENERKNELSFFNGHGEQLHNVADRHDHKAQAHQALRSIFNRKRNQ